MLATISPWVAYPKLIFNISAEISYERQYECELCFSMNEKYKNCIINLFYEIYVAHALYYMLIILIITYTLVIIIDSTICPWKCVFSLACNILLTISRFVSKQQVCVCVCTKLIKSISRWVGQGLANKSAWKIIKMLPIHVLQIC